MDQNYAAFERIFFAWFWVIACAGFVFDELTGQSASPVYFVVMALCDVVLLGMGVWAVCLTRSKADVAFIVSFLAISYWSTCMVNHSGLTIFLNGNRSFFPLLFIPAIYRYFSADPLRKQHFQAKMDRAMYVFLWIQAVCIVFQFLKYGSGDKVGGSMGSMGFSGIVSMLIYTFSFILMRRHLDTSHFLSSLKQNWIYIFLLFPSFLNETKISLFLIVMYFLLLIPIDRRLVIRLAIGIPVVALVASSGYYVYRQVNRDNAGTDMMSGDFIENYFIGEVENAEGNANYVQNFSDDELPDVPRVAKLMLVPMVMDQYGQWWSGFGVGQFKGGQSVAQPEFAQQWDWLVSGSIPYLFHMGIQLGITGTIWMLLLFISLFVLKPQDCRRDLNLQVFLVGIILILMLYNDAWSTSIFTTGTLLLALYSWIPQEDSTTAIDNETTA